MAWALGASRVVWGGGLRGQDEVGDNAEVAALGEVGSVRGCRVGWGGDRGSAWVGGGDVTEAGVGGGIEVGGACMRDRAVNGIIAGLGIVSLLSACGVGADFESGPLVRDSAGVEIVENMMPLWDADEAWQVGSTPLLMARRGEAEGPYLFREVLGAWRLGDGRLVVVDRGAREIVLFDADGHLVRSVGGEGDGSGALQSPSRAWLLPGDTVVVSDMGGLTVYDSAGNFARRVVAMVHDDAPVQPAAQLRDGTILGLAGSGPPPSVEPGAVLRDTVWFHRFGADGAHRGVFTALAAAPVAVIGGGGEATSYRRFPFTADPTVGTFGDDFVLTSATVPELEVWTSDGTLVRLIRWAPISRSLTLDHFMRYRDLLLESTSDPERRRAYDEFLAASPIPTHFPAVGEGTAILEDAAGFLWVKAYRLPWQEDGAWFVFAPDGGWLGTVHMPAGFTLHQVGTGEGVGSWREGGGEVVGVVGVG